MVGIEVSPVLGGGSGRGESVVPISVVILEGASTVFQVPGVVLVLQEHLLRKAHLSHKTNAYISASTRIPLKCSFVLFFCSFIRSSSCLLK